MNEFACSAYRSTLIRPAEREIKPPQNVVTNPFKCGGGGGALRCEPVRVVGSVGLKCGRLEAANAGLTNDKGSD